MSYSVRIFRDETGDPIPVIGKYHIDPQLTSAAFTSRHFVFAKVRARVATVSGLISIADNPASCHVEIEIPVGAISTGIAEHDRSLRGPNFFDVGVYPQLRFRSIDVQPDDEYWTVTGDLTIRGVTLPARLDVAFDGLNRSPSGDLRLAFTATTETALETWGLTPNVVDGSEFLGSNVVQIQIEGEAIASDRP